MAFTGRPWSETYRLEPGHEVVLRGSFNMQWIGADDTGPDNATFRDTHHANQQYQLQVSFSNGFDGDRRPSDGNKHRASGKLTIRTVEK